MQVQFSYCLFYKQHIDFYLKKLDLSHFGGFCYVLYNEYQICIFIFLHGLVPVTFPIHFLGYDHNTPSIPPRLYFLKLWYQVTYAYLYGGIGWCIGDHMSLSFPQ